MFIIEYFNQTYATKLGIILLPQNKIVSKFDKIIYNSKKYSPFCLQLMNFKKNHTKVKILAQVQKEGKRSVISDINFYNLDLIISVGYRVQSSLATAFRI